MNIQPDITIYSSVSLNAVLMDYRIGRYGQRFGTVEGICRQYGIKCTKLPTCYEFTAPKTRMLLFIEKLHFSGTGYSRK